MKITFEKNLAYQTDAVKSVVELFEGNKDGVDNSGVVVKNALTLSNLELKSNLERIQHAIGGVTTHSLKDFSIEMETGTGKTYTYIKTILELNSIYRFTKFIIIVPSVAIREGVLKTLSITKEHFKELYPTVNYTYFEYDSKLLVKVKDFGRSTTLQIMVMTLDSFNKDGNVLNNVQDSFGGRPIDVIAQTQPIVILDEPQNMTSELSKSSLATLNPLVCLRYSATHRELHNLIYKLTPYDAYDMGLVKQIKVCSVTKLDTQDPYIAYLGSEQKSTATVAFIEIIGGDGEKKKIKIKSDKKGIEDGGNLATLSKNPIYAGYLVDEFSKNDLKISTVGRVITLAKDEKLGSDKHAKYLLIRETIKEHILKEKALTPKGIKVLSLFFIDRVANYKEIDGELRMHFLNALDELSKDVNLTDTIKAWGDISKVHGGYFANGDKINKSEEKSMYDKILRDKEVLLSTDEPLRFIFSHSALREGWDNPNVFQICTLNETYSDIKKRQEIGRGLRLCVNQQGHRVYEEPRKIIRNINGIDVVEYKDNDINVLTVFANESYESYVSSLQKELEDDTGIKRQLKIINGDIQEKTVKLKPQALENELLTSLFDKMANKTEYTFVAMDEIELKNTILTNMKNEASLSNIGIETSYAITTANIASLSSDAIVDRYKYERNTVYKPILFSELIDELQNKTHLTKALLVEIIKNLGDNIICNLFISKKRIIAKLVEVIEASKHEHFLSKSVYAKLDDKFALEQLFEAEIKTRVEDALIVPTDNAENCIYDKIICDSTIEKQFISELMRRDDIKLAIKLPSAFKICTPIGSYNPDWAIVKEEPTGSLQYFYLVKETKSQRTEAALKEYSLEQWQKVQYGKLHFNALSFHGFSVVSKAAEV